MNKCWISWSYISIQSSVWGSESDEDDSQLDPSLHSCQIEFFKSFSTCMRFFDMCHLFWINKLFSVIPPCVLIFLWLHLCVVVLLPRDICVLLEFYPEIQSVSEGQMMSWNYRELKWLWLIVEIPPIFLLILLLLRFPRRESWQLWCEGMYWQLSAMNIPSPLCWQCNSCTFVKIRQWW